MRIDVAATGRAYHPFRAVLADQIDASRLDRAARGPPGVLGAPEARGVVDGDVRGHAERDVVEGVQLVEQGLELGGQHATGLILQLLQLGGLRVRLFGGAEVRSRQLGRLLGGGDGGQRIREDGVLQGELLVLQVRRRVAVLLVQVLARVERRVGPGRAVAPLPACRRARGLPGRRPYVSDTNGFRGTLRSIGR